MSVRARINDVAVRLGAVQALDGVDLTIEPGRFMALLGPSGSGKTTTLNVLAGFVQPDRGTLLLDGKDTTGVPPHRRDMGIVFQGYALFPHMSVADNVAFPLRMRKVRRDLRARRVRDALELVGLAEQATRSVATLSGGQQQRVALARAVVFEPRMLLLDEPLAALDKQLRETMQLELKRFQQRLGITAVAVTHDQVEALSMADEVAVLRDGRLEQVASPSTLYTRPASLFVATFLGEANLLEARGGELPAFGRVAGRESGTAIVRPEQLSIRPYEPARPPDGNIAVVGRVEDVTFQGARARLRVSVGADPAIVLTVAESTASPRAPSRVGDRVFVCLDAQHVHVIVASPEDRVASASEALAIRDSGGAAPLEH